MDSEIFVGRKYELNSLELLHRSSGSSLVVVKGRRRVGKSKLISHFAQQKKDDCRFFSFSGIAPQNGVTAQNQRDNFLQQLARIINSPPFTCYDWSEAFHHLGRHLKKGDIILLDEISWMAQGDPTFIPKIKAWWDSLDTEVMLFFCSSISTWVEANILKSTAFFGRINLTILLEPLSIKESSELLDSLGFKESFYEKYKLLSIFGGIPWYIKQFIAGQNTDEIIKRLCFTKNSLLVSEFDNIFHDLFDKSGENYKDILYSLKDGMKTLKEIRDHVEFAHGGSLNKMIDNLIIAGFIEKQYLWSFKTNKTLKQNLYRICDPYIRFYLKLIEPQKSKINSNFFHNSNIAKIPGFDSHIGLQIEYLLLQNRLSLLNAIGIQPENVIADGPYRQNKTLKTPGCQIDYLIQTNVNNIFLCEFKFKRSELSYDIIEQMNKKIASLKTPKNYAKIPILFHIGGVSENVDMSGYFYRIIDISDFL